MDFKAYIYEGLDGALHALIIPACGTGGALLIGLLFSLFGADAWFSTIGKEGIILLITIVLLPFVLMFTLGLFRPASAAMCSWIINNFLFMRLMDLSAYKGGHYDAVFTGIFAVFFLSLLYVQMAAASGAGMLVSTDDIGAWGGIVGVMVIFSTIILGLVFLYCGVVQEARPMTFIHWVLGINGAAGVISLPFNQRG